MPELAQLPVTELRPVMESLVLPPNDPSAEMLQKEIVTRLRYLIAVGLGYLNLDRPTRTLSGGEIERVNLTTCLGASLVNTLFVLDEPSVGLHPRDVGRLIRVMEDLRDKGNTLLVVEHEEAVIRSADNLIDIGPGRGEAGGELVFSGPLDAARQLPGFADGRLPDRPQDASRCPRAAAGRTDWLQIRGAREHNLRNIDVDLPLGVFGCVTGVSGSGKSTLIHDVLYQNLLRLNGPDAATRRSGRCDEISGADKFGTVVMVDQTPLAKTPRSSPVVYLGVFDAVRELFAMSDEARAAGLVGGAFSFNSGDGRCERCGGIGFEKIEMQFLSDLYVRCSECEGKRFQPHVLKVRYHGKNIHEVLEMTVAESDRRSSNRGTGCKGHARTSLQACRSRRCAFWTRSAWVTCVWVSRSTRSPAARRNGSSSSATSSSASAIPAARARCSSSTNPPPGCTSTTWRCSCACSSGWSNRATACWSSSTTWKSSSAPITSWTSAPRPARTAACSSPPARRRRSPRWRPRTRVITCARCSTARATKR